MTAWLEPVKNAKYRVTREQHKNRVGICIDTRKSGFGMKWAQLRFIGSKAEEKKSDWIRTVMLEEVK